MATTHIEKLHVSQVGDREILMERTFHASREAVFDAHVNCDHIKHWWGPRDYAVTSCESDPRPGGAWRVIHRDAQGKEYAFRGTYRVLIRPQRIERTFEFEGWPGQVSTEAMTLEEVDGKTLLIARSVFDSQKARDDMMQSGMEQGASESFDRLDDYLVTMEQDVRTRSSER